ncbi:hypothetical protein NEOLEDRAFT_768969 [Neolentinus lepideus HHB14362 ss-1]|uniref:DUF6534 domain-containing protein n=1 Tax=Neolentinus lepideus HHB14362 ss-1 TaxID=1314782 RepID=A0A165UTI1_9AGAM|nr:hypothetical protein NEOLEDRAFT_768969 [Neolentinus lepideus HHB14362 ss-1]
MAATLDNTLGVLYSSTLISATLYGVGCTQAWFYFQKYRRKDPWWVQTLVGVLWVLDTCQQAILSVYKYLVTFHDTAAIRAVLINTLIVEIFFSNFIAVLVQQFYCWRVYKLSKSWAIAGFLAAVSWTSFVALIVYCARSLQFSTFVELEKISTLSKTCNILAAVTDFLISIGMILVLNMSKTGFRRSTDMINRLMIFSFSTGLPTSFCAIMACVFISVLPNTFWYMFFFLQMGRLYTNSFMVTLNSRQYIRSMSNSEDAQESYSLPDRSPAINSIPSHLAIRIDRMMENDQDAQSQYHGHGKGVETDAQV